MSFLLAGCSEQFADPFQRPDTWHARDDNDANLQVMIANPQDLVRGEGDINSRGIAAAQPVHRLDTGRRLPLIQLNASGIDATQGADTQAQGGNNGGGNSGQQ